MDQQAELKVLHPNIDVTLSTGEVLTLKPFTFGQLPKALKLANGIAALIQNAHASGDFTSHALNIMADGGEDFLTLMAFGLGKDREFFDTLDAADGTLLSMEFLGVNYDFFIQRVLPLFRKGMEKLKAPKSQDSPTQ